jgi:outer membrane protein assembly factor BamE
MHNRSNLFNSISKRLALGICALSMTLIVGCTSLDNKPITDKIDRPIISRLFNPYRADVVQGNFVSKEQLESIRPGMNKDQVKQILGSPLVVDMFHPNRWDYVFSYRVGQTQEVDLRKVTLTFDGLVLAKIAADEVPTEQRFIDEIDEFRLKGRKVDNKVNLRAQDPNAPVNPVPAFPNPTSGAGIPPGGTRLDKD